MILINDGYGIGTINPKSIYTRIKARSAELRKIMDHENSSEERRACAHMEFAGYQEESQNLNLLNEFPFDILIVIKKEEEEE